MTKPHEFGGASWTQQKLKCVEDYSAAWIKIMSNNKFGWRTRYIDAFSGTGSYRPREQELDNRAIQLDFEDQESFRNERRALLDGSAKIALKMDPPFGRIDLIEMKPDHAKQLRILAGTDINNRVFVHEDDANSALSSISKAMSRSDRSLAFIDPYGCEVWWDTLKTLANTGKTDVWYLFPTMGVNRQLQKNPDEIPDYKSEALTRVLGTSDWKTAFYEDSISVDLFGNQQIERRAGPTAVERFFIERLRTIFPAVHDNCLQLRNSRNGHLFSLCFSVSNKSERAQEVAMRIAGHTIKKWGGGR